MDSTTLSFRVASEKARRLDELSTATARPKSWLLEQALDAYLEVQTWQVAHIEQGVRELVMTTETEPTAVGGYRG